MAQPTASEHANSALETNPEDLADLAQMEALATKHGYLYQKKELWVQELSASIASRMVPRLGRRRAEPRPKKMEAVTRVCRRCTVSKRGDE